MGRRKIEIQPITNERNRSVTFLKRKNGLFKKAHELGVLCSVDVAVIIFDERHGHDTKLFQYSSCDVRDIVQRHLRHTGERDTRGPTDFGEGGTGRNEAGDGEGEDEDEDGDAEEPLPPPKRTNSSSKKIIDDDDFKPSARVIADAEPKQRGSISNARSLPERRSSASLSTFPPLPFDTQRPMSNDRMHSAHHPRPYHDHPQNKRPRLDYSLDMNLSREHGHPLSAVSPSSHEPLYMYPPHAPSFRRSDGNHSSQYPPYGLPYSSSPSPNTHGSSYGPPFNPQSEFALGPHISSWNRSHGSSGTNSAAGDLPAFFSGGGTPLGPGGFDGLPFARGDDGRPLVSEKNGRDSFAHTFLEADQQRKVSIPAGGISVPRGTTSAASFGIDWPSHRPPSAPQAVAPPTPPIPPPAKSTPAPEKNGSAEGAQPPEGWLELLSATAPTANASSSEATIPTRSSSAAPSTS